MDLVKVIYTIYIYESLSFLCSDQFTIQSIINGQYVT